MFGKFMFLCGTPSPRCNNNTAAVDDDVETFQPMMTAVQKNHHLSISSPNNNHNEKSSIKTVGTPPDDEVDDDDDDDVIPPPVSPIGSGTDGGSQTSFSSSSDSTRGSETYDDTLIGDFESTSGSTLKTSEKYDNGSKVITYKRIASVCGGDDSMTDDDVGSKSTWFTYGGNSTANHTATGDDNDTAHTTNNNNNNNNQEEEGGGGVSVADSETTTASGIQSCVTDILIKNPSTDNKLMFMLDEVHELARIGQNVTLKSDNILPDGVSKDNIYVDVAIDDDALVYDDDEEEDEEDDEDSEKSEEEETDNDHHNQVVAAAAKTKTTSIRSKKLKIINNKEMIISVVDVICDDLSSVYCAESMEDAELVLCIVIVSLSGSRRVKTKKSSNKKSKNKKSIAEIGLTWQLFEPDTLQVYGGGLITQREDLLPSSSFDKDDGKQCLIQKIAPRIASKVMSKLAGNTSNDEFLVEV